MANYRMTPTSVLFLCWWAPILLLYAFSVLPRLHWTPHSGWRGRVEKKALLVGSERSSCWPRNIWRRLRFYGHLQSFAKQLLIGGSSSFGSCLDDGRRNRPLLLLFSSFSGERRKMTSDVSVKLSETGIYQRWRLTNTYDFREERLKPPIFEFSEGQLKNFKGPFFMFLSMSLISFFVFMFGIVVRKLFLLISILVCTISFRINAL